MVVINDSSLNAFAIKFAKKKVIVLVSETLEGVLDKPEELRVHSSAEARRLPAELHRAAAGRLLVSVASSRSTSRPPTAPRGS